MSVKTFIKKKILLAALSGAALCAAGCASVAQILAVDQPQKKTGPISNPFSAYDSGVAPADPSSPQNIVLRSRKGERSVEVELPSQQGVLSDFSFPLDPGFRGPASESTPGLVDERYLERRPTLTDREIVSALSQPRVEREADRREIELGLGLVESPDSVPAADRSFLAAMDHVKQLFKATRYEAALIEIDDLIRVYPTEARLYEMRGTLLDRVGRPELALKSWNQALRLDPSNQSLRRFIDRKEQKRGLASP